MARFCSSCGSPIADAASFCPSCGARTVAPSTSGGAAAAPGASAAGGLPDNVAGMLAYVTFIPAIVFLVLEPYSRNRFVRFHAFQSIFLCAALVIAHLVFTFIPIIGWAIAALISVAAFVAWIVLLVKAYGGNKTKLPVLGDLAEKYANA